MSANLKIVTCFPLGDEDQAALRRWLPESATLVVSDHDRIHREIMDADVYWGHAKGKPIDWGAVASLGRLQWIQSTAAGLDHCLAPEVVSSSIRVSGCSGLFAEQVAEQTLALLLGLVRRMPVFFKAQQKRSFERQPTDNLFDKSVGILGFGGNGRRIATVLDELCLRRLALDRFPEFDPLPGVECRGPGELAWLLAESDVLIVTLPQTDETEGLLGMREFGSMKKGSYLINVGRGSVVQTDALLTALDSGAIAGAGLDVVDPEPLPPSHPLWEQSEVIITPHVGAQSPRRIPMTLDLIRLNFGRFERGQRLMNEVDKQLGFPRPEDRWTGKSPAERSALPDGA